MNRTGSIHAQKRLDDIRRLMSHLALFLLVNVVAVGIDLADGAKGDTVLGLDWAHWLLIPWTVLFVGHLVMFFTRERRTSDEPPEEAHKSSEDEQLREPLKR